MSRTLRSSVARRSAARSTRVLAVAAALLAAPLGGVAQQPASGQSGMSGMDHSKMDHSKMAGMDRPAARDSNQAFLRMMSDHHEGLIKMADTARARATKTMTKADAHKLHDKQQSQQRMMVAMLRRQYRDTIMPMIIPSNQAMLDTLSSTSGAAADPTFYRLVIAHHEEGIQMIDRMLPSLTGQVRQMATKDRADQQKEVIQYRQKLARLGGQAPAGAAGQP